MSAKVIDFPRKNKNNVLFLKQQIRNNVIYLINKKQELQALVNKINGLQHTNILKVVKHEQD